MVLSFERNKQVTLPGQLSKSPWHGKSTIFFLVFHIIQNGGWCFHGDLLALPVCKSGSYGFFGVQIPLEFHHGYPPQKRDFLERKGATGFIRIHGFLVSSDQTLLGFMGESTFKLTMVSMNFGCFWVSIWPFSHCLMGNMRVMYREKPDGWIQLVGVAHVPHSKLQLRAEKIHLFCLHP